MYTNTIAIFQLTMAEGDPLSHKLIETCVNGDSGHALELITSGADPVYSDENGRTPLHWASMYVHCYAQLIHIVKQSTLY